MNIPFDIKIFSWIYESGKYLLPLLLVLWLTWLCCVIILRKKKQFLFTSVMFLLFCVINAFFTWCGWHYRMELRERYALVQAGKSGWLDTQTGKVYNINLMQSDIRWEYEKNSSSPRRRGVIAQIIWGIVLTPVTLLGQLILYLIYFRKRKAENGIIISPPKDWQHRLARAGFILGAFTGITIFILTGSGNIWQLWSCIPLYLAVHFGSWKSWRIPAIILALLFFYGGVFSCIKHIKHSSNPAIKVQSINFKPEK